MLTVQLIKKAYGETIASQYLNVTLVTELYGTISWTLFQFSRYQRVTDACNKTIFSGLDDCEKAGDACPSSLQCLAQENATYTCGCEAGLMVTGDGDARTCEGTINSSSKDWGYVTVYPMSFGYKPEATKLAF